MKNVVLLEKEVGERKDVRDVVILLERERSRKGSRSRNSSDKSNGNGSGNGMGNGAKGGLKKGFDMSLLQRFVKVREELFEIFNLRDYKKKNGRYSILSYLKKFLEKHEKENFTFMITVLPGVKVKLFEGGRRELTLLREYFRLRELVVNELLDFIDRTKMFYMISRKYRVSVDEVYDAFHDSVLKIIDSILPTSVSAIFSYVSLWVETELKRKYLSYYYPIEGEEEGSSLRVFSGVSSRKKITFIPFSCLSMGEEGDGEADDYEMRCLFQFYHSDFEEEDVFLSSSPEEILLRKEEEEELGRKCETAQDSSSFSETISEAFSIAEKMASGYFLKEFLKKEKKKEKEN